MTKPSPTLAQLILMYSVLAIPYKREFDKGGGWAVWWWLKL